jgi:CheY-like chemotaxis protein
MSYTLLLADASATIQRIVELTFASEDIDVVAFSNGEHAIASLDRNVPDIVLADVGMPGRSGYEVSRYIKNSPPLAHIPVLLLTGAFEPVDQAKALEAGCDGILIKPFEPKFVIGRVKELLKRPRPGSKEDEVEQYFEELDKAFANLSSLPPTPGVEAATPSAAPTAVSSPVVSIVETAVAEPLHEVVANVSRRAEPDVPLPAAEPFAPSPAAETAIDVPLMPEQPIHADGVPEPTTAAPEPERAIAASIAPRPTLAEAFTALLEAERSGNGNAPTLTPISTARSLPSDEVIERVTRRVLEQLSDAVVRETVTSIVQATAERLVREEIERIKSNIK